MDYRHLGLTSLKVSLLCLGTMTWGGQNTELQAHQQLDFAIDSGINFIDTAEIYPLPRQEETQGRTESYIGSWFASRKNRDKVILGTKIASCAPGNSGNPGELTRFNKKNIEQALDNSLNRLQTDYIDLYQLHWPDREINNLYRLGYQDTEIDHSALMEETLTALNEMVQAGKVRYIGVSNETPWGLMKYLEVAKYHHQPRVVSIQNPYSLINRTFEIGLAEVAIREQCGLLAYSPLAFGMLTGKYLKGARPMDSRITLFERYIRYANPQAEQATERYVQLAKEFGVSPAQMALAFVSSRPFVTSTIIGATKMEQLQENIESLQVKLPQPILDQIEMIHHEIPNPAP